MTNFAGNSKALTDALMINAKGQIETQVRCPYCGEPITKPEELEFYQGVGMCAMCDHIRSEVYCDMAFEEEQE
jgi:hypothetical protein